MLKDRLHDLGVEVNVKTFEEAQGIVGLGEDPFVSLFNFQEYYGLQNLGEKVALSILWADHVL